MSRVSGHGAARLIPRLLLVLFLILVEVLGGGASSARLHVLDMRRHGAEGDLPFAELVECVGGEGVDAGLYEICDTALCFGELRRLLVEPAVEPQDEQCLLFGCAEDEIDELRERSAELCGVG